MFALVDCNSFYASCERLFRPDLKNKPIVVLSNNDGCCVAMCERAKALGITTGVPYFQIQETLARHGGAVFSSNYTLYGDLSRRVMNTLARFTPYMEVYSIDEAFLDCYGLGAIHLPQYAQTLRTTVLQHIGIPTCVGMAPTKVLAKAANRVAKKFKERTQGVWVLDTPEKTAKCLEWLPIEDVWGIGSRQGAKLKALGVQTALDFVRLPSAQVRSLLSIVGVRLQQELQGVSCLPLEWVVPRKQSIATTRSFGQLLQDLPPIESAVAYFAGQCASKLRAQRLCARFMVVFLQTNPFQPGQPQRHVSKTYTFPVESSDTFELIECALVLLRQLWAPGYHYKKAGVLVHGLVSETQIQGDLFDPVNRVRARQSMRAMDAVNQKYGTDFIRSGAFEPTGDWRLRRERLSPCYTTDWDQLLTISLNGIGPSNPNV